MDIIDYIEIVFIIVIILAVVIVFGYAIFTNIYSVTAGNKQAFDLKYNFEKAICYMNGEKIEIEIDKWNDYDGEQIQIIGKDGNVYLISSFNTILIGK